MKVTKGTVKVTFGSGASEREVTREVSYNELETSDDVLAVLQNADEAKKLIANANYGANLQARSSVRAAIITADAGPEKAIEKAIADAQKARTANGKPPMTDAQIEAFKAMLNS